MSSFKWAPCGNGVALVDRRLVKDQGYLPPIPASLVPSWCGHCEPSNIKASGTAFPGQEHFPRSKGELQAVGLKLGTTRLPPKHIVATWITSNACASRAVEVQQRPARAFSSPQRQRDEPLETTDHPAQDQVAAGGRSRGDGYEAKASSPEMREDLEAASVRSAARKPFYKRNKMMSSC